MYTRLFIIASQLVILNGNNYLDFPQKKLGGTLHFYLTKPIVNLKLHGLYLLFKCDNNLNRFANDLMTLTY